MDVPRQCTGSRFKPKNPDILISAINADVGSWNDSCQNVPLSSIIILSTQLTEHVTPVNCIAVSSSEQCQQNILRLLMLRLTSVCLNLVQTVLEQMHTDTMDITENTTGNYREYYSKAVVYVFLMQSSSTGKHI